MNRIIPTLCLMCVSTPALAQQRIDVTRRNATCAPCDGASTTYCIDQLIEGSTIEIRGSLNAPLCGTITTVPRVVACTERININRFDSFTQINPINVRDGGSVCGILEVVLGDSVFINPLALPNKAPGNWAGVSRMNPSASIAEIFYGGCSGDLTGSISGFDQLVRFDCDGTIKGTISAPSGLLGSNGTVIFAGAVSSSGELNLGQIQSVTVTGDFNGSIISNDVNGDIQVLGTGGSGSIEIDGDMLGNIDVAGDLYRVKFTGGVGSTNALNGDLSVHTLGRPDVKEGSFTGSILNGNIEVEQDILENACSINTDWTGANRVISVGRTLSERNATDQALVGNRNLLFSDTDQSDAALTNGIDADKFIIINAGNNTPTGDPNNDGVNDLADFWLGGVSLDWPGGAALQFITDKNTPVVDEVLLSPSLPSDPQYDPYRSPYYTALSHEIGGGSVGVAPFNFHQFAGPAPADRSLLDCDPHHGEFYIIDNCDPTTDIDQVVIDHYGPVYVVGTDTQTSSADNYVRVEFRPNYIPSIWRDVSDQFTADLTQTNNSDAAPYNRELVIKPWDPAATGFKAPGYFRIRPLAGKVKCAAVQGLPDVQYESNVVSGDLGSTGGTQYDWYQFHVQIRLCQQMTVFQGDQVNGADITAWATEPFEVNADGATDALDFVDMADAYEGD